MSFLYCPGGGGEIFSDFWHRWTGQIAWKKRLGEKRGVGNVYMGVVRFTGEGGGDRLPETRKISNVLL